MKFSIDGNTLKEAAGLVDQAASYKSDLPEHSSILVAVSNTAGLALCGHNGRFMVTVKGITVGNPEEGKFLIDLKKWSSLIAVCGGKVVQVTTNSQLSEASIVLTPPQGAASKFNLGIMPADSYKGIGSSPVIAKCKTDKWQLKDAISVVRPAADSDNSLELINGVCFEFGSSATKLIATDTTTLGFANVPVVYEGAAPSTQSIIRVVPKDTMELIDRMISQFKGDNVTISIHDELVSFRTDLVELTTQILAGGTSYINWQRHIPDAVDGPNFQTAESDLLQAMTLAEIPNNGESLGVDFSISNSKIKVESQGTGGTYSGELPCTSIYGSAKFRLDSKLVKTNLRNLDSRIQLQISPVDHGRRIQVIPFLTNLSSPAFQIWGARTRKADA